MSSQKAVAVFGSSQTKPGTLEWEVAESTGARLADAGLAVVTGGYGGTMEAASKGAAEAGGHTIGVIAPELFPGRSGANRYVGELIEADTITSRIGAIVAAADGAIALPGSIGTAAELLIAWNINHIVRRNGGRPYPTVAVGAEWRQVAEALTTQVGANSGDVHLEEDAGRAADWIIEQLKIQQT